MAKLMLTGHPNGRTGSVGGLLNLGADLKEVVEAQGQVYSKNRYKGFWKGVFELGKAAVLPYTSSIVPLISSVSPIVEFSTRLCKFPKNSEGQLHYYQAPDLVNKVSSDPFASRNFPQQRCTNQTMALLESWKDTQSTTGECTCTNSTWFEVSVPDRFHLSKLTSRQRPNTLDGLLDSCTAVPNHPALEKFTDEDKNPQEPVDSWEELHDMLAVEEKVSSSECLHSLVLCETTHPFSEALSEADGQVCSNNLHQLLQSTNALEGVNCQEIQTCCSDSSKNCSQKVEHSDLTYVLFDRSGKYSGKSRKRRRQSKQKSKQQTSTLDSMMGCFGLVPVSEDSFSDVLFAPCEKWKSSKSSHKKKSKSIDSGCSLVDQGLSFSGLGDFLPGCKKLVHNASATPRISDPQADLVLVPSRTICELNQAWDINPEKPDHVSPKEKSKVSALSPYKVLFCT